MRVRRLLAAIVTTGLIAPTAVVVASSTAPASAAVATSIVASTAGRPLIYAFRAPATVGDNLYSNVDIVAADGSSPYGGTTTVQQLLAGQSTWTTVSTTSGAYASLSGVKARSNATYRITWSGNQDWSGSTAVVNLNVTRKITTNSIRGRNAGIKGKVKPAARIKIVAQKKVGKKWKKYKAVRTNRKGRYTLILPAPSKGRFHWKITFAGGKGFTKTVIKGSTYRGY